MLHNSTPFVVELSAYRRTISMLEVMSEYGMPGGLKTAADIGDTAAIHQKLKLKEGLTAVVIVMVTAQIHYDDKVATPGDTQSDAIFLGSVTVSSVWAYSHC